MVDPKSSIIEIELIGNGSIVVEHNGIKYAFDGRNRVRSMPVGAYIEALISGHHSSDHLIPVVKEGAATNDYLALKASLAKANGSIGGLKKEVGKLKDDLNLALADKLAFEERSKRLEKVEKEKECLASEIAKLKNPAPKKGTKK